MNYIKRLLKELREDIRLDLIQIWQDIRPMRNK